MNSIILNVEMEGLEVQGHRMDNTNIEENNNKEDAIDRNKYIGRILKQTDLYNIFPFQKTKVQQLIKSGELPLVKVGKDYITTFKLLEEWISDHIGEEIYY